MGIPGLKKFMRKLMKTATSEDYKQGIVVDGKSLIYHLASKFQVTCTFGGQYGELETILEVFFRDLLRNCEIVVVVFDGIDYDERKRDTKLKRKRYWYSEISNALTENKEIYLLPALTDLVFCHVFRKLKVPFIFVDGDADQKIAQIANFYQFPVIADDSDYFIFDLCAGYMPLYTFEMEGGTVSALLYKRNFLVHRAEFCSPDLVLGIPLLIGNDFYNASIWKNLLDNLRGEQGSGQAVKTNIELVVNLLAQSSSLAECIQKLEEEMSRLDLVRVQSLSNGADQMKRVYNSEPSFSSDPIAEMKMHALMNQKDSRPVPEKLLRFFREGEADLKILEALCKNYVDLRTWFEDLNQPFCRNIGKPLRATLYALVHLDQDKLVITEEVRCHPYKNDFKLTQVQVVRTEVLPMIPPSCKSFEDICQLCPDIRKEAIMHCLQVPPSTATAIERLPSHLHLLAMVTRYWYHYAVPKPTPVWLRALILMLLHQDTRREVPTFDRRATHSCVQWQEVLLDVHDLNNLLSTPFTPLPPVSKVFDGRMFQSLIKDKSLMKKEDALSCDKGLFRSLISLASNDYEHGAPRPTLPHPHAKKRSCTSSILLNNPYYVLSQLDDADN